MIGILFNFIDAVGWEDNVFEIWMKNGTGYRHYGVPRERYEAFFANSAFGKNYSSIKRDFPAPEKFPIAPRQ